MAPRWIWGVFQQSHCRSNTMPTHLASLGSLVHPHQTEVQNSRPTHSSSTQEVPRRTRRITCLARSACRWLRFRLTRCESRRRPVPQRPARTRQCRASVAAQGADIPAFGGYPRQQAVPGPGRVGPAGRAGAQPRGNGWTRSRTRETDYRTVITPSCLPRLAGVARLTG